MKTRCYEKSVDSTNELMWKLTREYELPEGFVLYTDFQRAGKGQVGNVWESASKKNILFSMLLMPSHVPVGEQFIISQIVSVGIKRTLDKYTSGISVKWPNDIYWNDKKIAGILIENSLQGSEIKYSVVGVGLNVNQKKFVSEAPNPVSLAQILEKNISRKTLLNEICENIENLYRRLDIENIRDEYFNLLYRRTGLHQFKDEAGIFKAKIVRVHPDGQLELETEERQKKGYYFKEVQFLH